MTERSSAVTAERIANALLVVARIVAVDERALPIYERLERELVNFQSRETTLERARALAARSAPRKLQQRLQHHAR